MLSTFLRKTSYIAIGTLLGGSVNVILAIMLIPVYGYKIAVVCPSLLSYVVYFLFHYYSAYNLLKKDIFGLKVLGYNILFVAVISLFVLYTVEYIHKNGGFNDNNWIYSYESEIVGKNLPMND